MRIVTNKRNLPQTLVDAVTYDTHRTAGDISMTTLIDAPQVRFLRRLLEDYEEDVADMMWALLGTAVHAILERANHKNHDYVAFLTVLAKLKQEAEWARGIDNDYADKMMMMHGDLKTMADIWYPQKESKYIFEETLSVKIGDMMVSGTFDLYDKETQTLYDYKVCSVYSYIFPEKRKKWTMQTNGYALFLNKTGRPVKRIAVIAIFRDWSEMAYFSNKGDYPPRQTMELEIKLGDMGKVEKWLESRVALHRRAEMGETIPCTGEERWAKADEYALLTASAKKSIKNTDTLEKAWNLAEEMQPTKTEKIFVEQRVGGNNRCVKFCQVSHICPQFKEYVKHDKQWFTERGAEPILHRPGTRQ